MDKQQLIKLEHKYKMEEIEAKRKAEVEVLRLKFDLECQVQRIKSAEIRKSIDRKEDKRFMEGYVK